MTATLETTHTRKPVDTETAEKRANLEGAAEIKLFAHYVAYWEWTPGQLWSREAERADAAEERGWYRYASEVSRVKSRLIEQNIQRGNDHGPVAGQQDGWRDGRTNYTMTAAAAGVIRTSGEAR